jgi:hypothetical protein
MLAVGEVQVIALHLQVVLEAVVLVEEEVLVAQEV